MLKLYLHIAFIFFIINGIAYNKFLLGEEEEPPILVTLKIALIYGVMALFFPIQIIYMLKIFLKEFKNGKGN